MERESDLRGDGAEDSGEGGGVSEEIINPTATVRYHTTGGNVGLAWTAVPHEDSDRHPKDGEPLYDRQAIGAMQAEPDCRICARFTRASGGCLSTVNCVNADQFQATRPHQYWKRTV